MTPLVCAPYLERQGLIIYISTVRLHRASWTQTSYPGTGDSNSLIGGGDIPLSSGSRGAQWPTAQELSLKASVIEREIHALHLRLSELQSHPSLYPPLCKQVPPLGCLMRTCICSCSELTVRTCMGSLCSCGVSGAGRGANLGWVWRALSSNCA